MSEIVCAERNPDLRALTDDRLAACARRLAARANLRASVGGKDASDFVQEAARRLMDGDRRADPTLSIDENLYRIGLSLVWAERQRAHAEPLVDEPTAQPESEPVARPDLRDALVDAQALLRERPPRGRVGRDAIDFVACLLHQLERGASIKPGRLADILQIGPARAYAAWRYVKTILREHLEETES